MYSSTLSLTLTLDGGGVFKTMPWLLYPLQRDLVAIVQEAGWAPGLVGMGAQILTSTGIRSPDHPACREFLYWLCFPSSPTVAIIFVVNCHMTEAENR
jgi:hypothetical protein